MKRNISLSLLAVSLACVSLNVYAITCKEFTQKGPVVKSIEDVLNTDSSKDQVNILKEIIAEHAANIASSWFSDKKKALDIVRSKNKIPDILSYTLISTRGDCFFKPDKNVSDVAIQTFDDVLLKIIK